MKNIKEKIVNAVKNNVIFILVISCMIIFSLTNKITIVNGSSMYPTLKTGQIVLVSKIMKPNDKDIIILDTTKASNWDKPDAKYIIKRYYKEDSTDGNYYVLGDNYSNSYDSRYVGQFDKSCYIGKVYFITNLNISNILGGIIN